MNKKIEAVCPDCGYEMDDATGMGEAVGARPEVGNLAVCIRCAGLGIYVEKKDGILGLRPTTEEEKVELSQDPGVTKARAFVIGLGVWMKK